MVAGTVRAPNPGRAVSDLGREDTALAWVELAELLRRGETLTLQLLGLLRGVEPELATPASIALSAEQTAEVLHGCESLGQWADELIGLAAVLRSHEVEIRRQDLRREAGAALAAGVADVERVLLLARCLPVDAGFRALAESLRCTSCHESWHDATVGEVLSGFRGSDRHVTRRVTEEALMSPATRWEACDRMRLTRLAHALEKFAAARSPCR